MFLEMSGDRDRRRQGGWREQPAAETQVGLLKCPHSLLQGRSWICFSEGREVGEGTLEWRWLGGGGEFIWRE